jgi:hypothetical protein
MAILYLCLLGVKIGNWSNYCLFRSMLHNRGFCAMTNNSYSLDFIVLQSKNAGNGTKKGGDSPEKDQLLRWILLEFSG